MVNTLLLFDCVTLADMATWFYSACSASPSSSTMAVTVPRYPDGGASKDWWRTFRSGSTWKGDVLGAEIHGLWSYDYHSQSKTLFVTVSSVLRPSSTQQKQLTLGVIDTLEVMVELKGRAR